MEMDSGEVMLMFGGAVGGLMMLIRQAHRVLQVTELAGSQENRVPLLFLQPILLAGLWLFIATSAAKEVRETVGYQVLFVAATAVAFGFATRGLAVLGIDLIADGVERYNPAAQIACGGLWVAITICSGGANLGEGDFVFTTIGPFVFAELLLLAFAAGFSVATSGFEAIVIEHNVWAGVRFAGWLIAGSLPLAWAASGDWVSAEATLHDFGRTVPVLLGLLACGITIERRGNAVRTP